ncbi:TonB-dependent hemoglobin/transferrin/lactoferrin family receptor [Qipengyuania qiaonensis]|uniref:TonB-dependent hemoglobin/transferrin/lactoferrin family receptor n=1 Tax=Qipengyuania qiaonensis TaxID=2867240 RepID=A0ABS7J8F0_9SPHN|nr:TonB-dependent hemoglobin/transferrin/lactoferrin family receptor [Qipengyuania qiaonensis]MBX7483595.1 TonB-dependent hemoglobin/transferrin/lactoferrin family receptor [Qipengyuania qiaonensis]
MRSRREIARPASVGAPCSNRAQLRTGATLLALAAAASPAMVSANAEAVADAEETTGRIVVTATRTPLEIEDAPATVTDIDDEQIADELATDIKDLVRYEPGVSVRRAPARFGAALGTAGRARNEDFVIRGIGGNRVLIQVDGIRSPQGFTFGAQDAGRGGYTDVSLVKSVEILRGPASALYGSDGLAGAISFTTSDPVDLIGAGETVGGFVRASYASEDSEFAETAALAGRFGNFSAMLAYTRRDFEELDNQGDVGGTGSGRTRPNPQDGKSNALLGKLVWHAGGHRIRLTGEYLDSRIYSDVQSGLEPTYLFGPPPAPPAWIVDRLVADDETERKRVSLDWTWEGEETVEYANLAVYGQDGEDIQYTEEDRTGVALPAPDRTRMNTFENRVWGASAEVRTQFATGSVDYRAILGGDISWTNQKGLRDGTVPPSGETFPTSAFPETDFMLGGIFLGNEIGFFDGALTLYPALRFDFYSLDPQTDPLYPDPNLGAQDDSRLSPKVGAVVKLGEDIRLFANYAQGFRAPTPFQINNFFSNPAFGYTSRPNPDLGPERSESWEGGIRYNNDGLSLSAVAFKADYKDFIDQAVVGGAGTPADPSIFQYVNIGRVEIEGLEGRAELRFDSGFTGRFAIAYADGDEILPGGGKVPLESVDPLNLVAGVGYRDPGGRFGGELIMTHHARKGAERTGADNYRPNAFMILDATAFFSITDMLKLRAGIFNISNETYSYWQDVRGLSSTASTTDPATGGALADAYTRPGRNASVSLSFQF